MKTDKEFDILIERYFIRHSSKHMIVEAADAVTATRIALEKAKTYDPENFEPVSDDLSFAAQCVTPGCENIVVSDVKLPDEGEE